MPATSAMPDVRPTVAPTALADALARMGKLHARQLAAANALLSVRPAVIMPNNPMPVAIHRVELGCAQGIVDLSGETARYARLLDLAPPIHAREESGETHEEEQHRDEEEEQPEGDGAADDRAGGVAVTLVDLQRERDRCPVAVGINGPLGSLLGRLRRRLAPANEAAETGRLGDGEAVVRLGVRGRLRRRTDHRSIIPAHGGDARASAGSPPAR